ncbi:hypothetical protein ACVWW5_008080 [Bradyrhizobium sp. LM3.4]
MFLPVNRGEPSRDPLKRMTLRATLRDPEGFGHIGWMIRLWGSSVPWRASRRPAFPNLCFLGDRASSAMKVTVERAQPPEVAGPCPPRGRAPQHDSNPRQRAGPGREREIVAEGDRPRPRGDGNARGGNRDRRVHHRAGAHVLRHRAQAARWFADRARSRRRPRRAGDPRRPLPFHAADAAGE